MWFNLLQTYCSIAPLLRSAEVHIQQTKLRPKMHGLIIIVLKQAITLSRPETSFCATNLIRTEGILFQWEPGTTELKILQRKTKAKRRQGGFCIGKKQPKFFWKTIKKKLKKKAQQSEKITITELFDHFKSIYGEDENSTGQEDRDLHVNPEQVVNEELDAEISLTEIKNAVFAQKK